MNDALSLLSLRSPHQLRDPHCPASFNQAPFCLSANIQGHWDTPSPSLACASTETSDPRHIMSSRKRKADHEPEDAVYDRMSFSPSPAPASLPRTHIHDPHRHLKRSRTNVTGRPLALPRLLETLSADDMRSVLQTICSNHPEIGSEIVTTAPQPTVVSVLDVLRSYQSALRESFPYGDRPTSEYAYNRVRQSLLNLIDALQDYTPQFLPPNEQSPTTSLSFLDGATEVISELPDWDAFQHARHKQEAYEEIAKAWILVIKEAAKKGGGIRMQLGRWEQKLSRHNQNSGGKLQDVLTELRASLEWIEHKAAGTPESSNGASLRQQLASGSYGLNLPVEVGPW